MSLSVLILAHHGKDFYFFIKCTNNSPIGWTPCKNAWNFHVFPSDVSYIQMKNLPREVMYNLMPNWKVWSNIWESGNSFGDSSSLRQKILPSPMLMVGIGIHLPPFHSPLLSLLGTMLYKKSHSHLCAFIYANGHKRYLEVFFSFMGQNL